MAERGGQCMCGAVRFKVTEVPTEYGACHCEMCRRWTGSAFLGVSVPRERFTWTGEQNIATLQSSAWAERAWCRECGTCLWYRVTTEGPMSANLELPIGLLDNADDLRMTRQIFIDQKPAAFAYQGDHKLLTRAEVMALYGVELD